MLAVIVQIEVDGRRNRGRDGAIEPEERDVVREPDQIIGAGDEAEVRRGAGRSGLHEHDLAARREGVCEVKLFDRTRRVRDELEIDILDVERRRVAMVGEAVTGRQDPPWRDERPRAIPLSAAVPVLDRQLRNRAVHPGRVEVTIGQRGLANPEGVARLDVGRMIRAAKPPRRS